MDPIGNASVPYVDTPLMVEIDRAMMEDYQIGLIQMMENAGRNLAHLARQRFFSGAPIGKRVAVMAGSGGNGGGALVAARHLHNWGARVHVCLGKPVESLGTVPRHQLDILQRMTIGGVTAVARDAGLDAPFDLILDGLIGYSLRGAPQDRIAELIHWANHRDTPIVSLDIPSGVDATTGTVYDPVIHAAATLTLALPKTGLRNSGFKEHVGELYLADIGVPPELYSSPAIGLEVGTLFAYHKVIRLW
ncbi:MAG: NAD(P)H-hydrate epimerase [Pseudomonadota bacterium]|nr:NAD(P)H-hydrate epimerase [Pseudomonadota bacterium]